MADAQADTIKCASCGDICPVEDTVTFEDEEIGGSVSFCLECIEWAQWRVGG